MRRTAIATIFLLVVSGCGTPGPESYGPYPANYHDIVAEQVRANFFDPSALQDVWISAPFQGRLIFDYGWVVCLRANGKNRLGAYAGRQEYGYLGPVCKVIDG